MSRTDPASAWSARTVRGRFGYALNVLIDTPGGVAMEVEATPARFAAEVDAGRAMLGRAGERFDYRPKRVAADTAYGSAAFLAFVREKGAMPHIPVLERSEQSRCLIPGFDGAVSSPAWKEALWDRFSTAAPQRLRQSVERYSIVKRA